MSHRKTWAVNSILLALAALVGVAVMTGVSAAAHPAAGGAAAVSAAPSVGAPEATPTADAGTEPASPNDDSAETTAACRRAPECSVDSDCDAQCGIGLGKCVHSSCPVRICKCH
jgi:hypothetical protein